MRMARIKFVIYESCPTVTHQSKIIIRRGRHGSLADTKQLKEAIKWWESRLKPFVPEVPLRTPISLEVNIVWPFRKSEPKYIREKPYPIPHTVKPDASNMAKTIEDVMEDLGFFGNDSGVCDVRCKKWWWSKPSVTITMEELPDARKK